MADSVTVEFSKLESKLSEMMGALIGRGATGGDLGKALTVEAGQCAWRIAEQLGPASKADASKKVEKDMKTQLSTVPGFSNLNERQQNSSYEGFQWLAAGPNWLLGINSDDNKPGASLDEALQIYYNGKTSKPRGESYEILGIRKPQRIMRLNRTRISKSVFKAVKAAIASKFGQSKAAFARVSAEFTPHKRIPSWVMDKIPVVIANGKSVLNDGRESDVSPFVEFGSRAKGVSSNPVIADKIKSAFVQSHYALSAKMDKIVKGYTYNWNTGQVFKPVQFDEN